MNSACYATTATNDTDSRHIFEDLDGRRLRDVVSRVQEGHDSGLADLYRIFRESARSISYGLGQQDQEDRMHDVFLIVVRSIRHGELREPERLLGFIHGVFRRQAASVVVRLVRNRRRMADVAALHTLPAKMGNPEQSVACHERGELLKAVLEGLSPREREILTRFYVQEERPDQICSDMGLSENQFRLMKSRAKGRLAELAQKETTRRRQRQYALVA